MEESKLNGRTLVHKSTSLRFDSELGVFHASYSWSGPQLPKGCGCIGFMSPMNKKITDSYLKRAESNPREFWFYVSTIDGSTLPQDCVEEQLC